MVTRAPLQLKTRNAAHHDGLCGIFRNGPELDKAVAELKVLLERSRKLGLKCKKRHANPELVEALRVKRMLKVALTVLWRSGTNRKSWCPCSRTTIHSAMIAIG